MKMNRIISATIAAGTAAMMLLASCQRDELTGGIPAGEEVTVSISAVMPEGGEPVVRSPTDPGDGSDVNRCIMSIYLADEDLQAPILYADKVTAQVSGKTAVFPDQRLVSGHEYRFVFWADHVADASSEDGRATDLHYETDAFPTVTFVDGEAYKSNDDTRDAFFLVEDVTISGPSAQNFELRRPFGQLNIITNDWGSIPEEAAAQLRPSKVKLTFNDVPNSIDLMTGEVSGTADLTGEDVAVSAVAATGDAKHLSFDYILAKEGEQTVLADFTMDFLLADGTTEVTDSYTFTSIPVQRNYRTNVSGNLLTDRTGVEIEVVPDFDGQLPEEVSTSADIMNVLAEGGFVRLAQDVTLDKKDGAATAIGIAAGKNVQIDLNGHKLTLNNALAATADATLTLMNGSVQGQGLGQTSLLLFATTDGSVVLDDVDMIADGAGVGIESRADGADITIRNSSITALSFAVGTNAATPAQNNKVVIEKSTLYAWSAVLFNIPSTLEITNSEVTGANHGLILRGGTATITNSTFSINYNEGNAENDAQFRRDENWGEGNYLPYAAITAGNRSTGYQYPTTLTMTGCTVQSIGQDAEYFPAMYVYANPEDGMGVTIDYSDCVITGDFEVCSGNVTVNGAAFDAPGQSVSVSDSQTLAEVLANMGTAEGQTQHLQVTLSEDVTLSEGDVPSDFVPENGSLNLNLGGHTLTFGASLTAENSSVTFSDGTIVTEIVINKPGDVSIDALAVGENGSMTFDGITLESNGSGVGINGTTSGGRLTIKNSKITSVAYGVATNATSPESENVVITLENSEFAGDDPVFINIPCTLNMTGCTLNGKVHGLVVRGGTANVKDCRITLIYPEDESTEEAQAMADYFKNANWATGNEINITAVAVGNKVADNSISYKYPSVLNIENSTIETAGVHADLFPALYVWANKEAENGVTITYDGATKFYGDRTYGNGGANTKVNGSTPISDEGDIRPTE